MIQNKEIARLHYLTQDEVPGFSHAQQAEEACRAGVKWLQLRTKGKSDKEWLELAESVRQITKNYGARLIVNDNVSIAQHVRADGVHLGQKDMPVREARAILGKTAIIGGTANNEKEFEVLLQSDVDYIGLGPFRFTGTKKNLSPVLEWNRIQAMLQLQDKIPVILIGGIRLEDVTEIMAAGAHGIAVSSAINLSGDIARTAMHFNKAVALKPLTINMYPWVTN